MDLRVFMCSAVYMGFVSCISDALETPRCPIAFLKPTGCRLLVTKMFSQATIVDYVGGNQHTSDPSAAWKLRRCRSSRGASQQTGSSGM
jgi:hypothetical protein